MMLDDTAVRDDERQEAERIYTRMSTQPPQTNRTMVSFKEICDNDDDDDDDDDHLGSLTGCSFTWSTALHKNTRMQKCVW